MQDILLFTKPDCQKCDYVKERLPEGVDIELIDATTVDGMAEAAFYEVLEEPTPILVYNGDVVTGALKIINRLESLNEEQ